ncbi:MAG: hypothetical protein IT454_17975, partial [Planctomycetes bacterium]|nr:hypothetical protein [Planctomycetota bacterium]
MENQEQVIARVWVHPTDGVDPNPPSTPPESQYIDDPSLEFKSLQAAIDALERHLATNYNATSNPAEQGVVYAMPGLYGPHGASTSSNDSLPILMRDRVHVIGVGARRCVIRGASTLALPAPNAPALYWPVNFAAPHASQSAEVLVDFQRSTPDAPVPPTLNIPAPWLQTGPFSESNNIAEVLDGFSFQGGDVQVLLMSHALQPALWSSSRISNCVFDMRHGWAVSGSAAPPQAQLAGPYFGIMMQRRSIAQTSGVVGYLDGSTLIAHNSFIFAEWGDSATNQGWAWESRLEAVGIIDVTNPVFSTGQYDPYTLPRGVGNPCIVGNLFRTRPEFLSNPPPSPLPPKPFAMLGISLDDTLVWNGQSFVQTNAFDPARVGSTNGNGSSGSGFNARPTASMRVETGAANSFNDLWNCSTYTQTQQPPNCSATAAPTPAVAIWDGSSGFDPAFVGEYLATVQSGAYPYLVGYRDWRLLPSSPLENLGVTPPLGGPRAYQTQFSAQTGGWMFQLAANTDVDMLQWDGEHWGNPRVVDGAPDIGFDERHLLICAGSWSNDSNSHNAAG